MAGETWDPCDAPQSSVANDLLNSDMQPTHVVGIGASAGGLEALERFFGCVPVQSGLAFVVLQHLSPDFKSMTSELLARRTPVPIYSVQDGMQVERDAIYVLPPKSDMIISNGKLLLTDKDPRQSMTLPIDRFFRSLAQDAGDRSIGIVLSGTGSDGSRGIRDIHDAGGLVLAQAPETAKFDGMPNSALKTGVVDASLSPEDMPAALVKYARHPLSLRPTRDETIPSDETAMEGVFRLLRNTYGVDFSHYQPPTVSRRTERRLLLSGAATLEDYARRLVDDPEELNALYKDLLIGVTRFFRDREAFEILEKQVLPRMLERLGADDEFRVWVAGCATGEEAYSLAILIREILDASNKSANVKVFATDAHRLSIETAGAGIYSEASLFDVSPARLERHFTRKGDQYQVSPELRKMVVFAQHNVMKDAPFTKLDLISCRNLLIYFQPPSQKKVVSLFHFGLRTGGVLLLGPSESPGELENEFDAVDKHWKVYRKRRDIRLPADIRLGTSEALRPRSVGLPAIGPAGAGTESQLVGVYDALLDDFMPPCWLVNDRRELVQSFGGAHRLLRLKEGRMSTDLTELVDAEMRMTLSGALQRVFKEQKPVAYKGLPLTLPDGARTVNMTVKPAVNRRTNAPYALVLIEELESAPQAAPEIQQIDLNRISRDHLYSIESELRYTKENLQATIEELETSNEELQATNEELLASNEELQSTNEELHSVNEELYTVNAEYQKKILELTELTSDMDNLLASTEVHTVFLDRNLCVRKFTPKIAETFNLLPQDVGRRIDSFTHSIDDPRMLADLHAVLEGHEPIERRVTDHSGRWYLLRILPYRVEREIEGVVLTLIEITGLKRAESEAFVKDRQLTSILMNSPHLISIKDVNGRFVLADASFQRLVGCDPAGKTADEFLPPDAAEFLKSCDRRVVEEGTVVEHELTMTHADGPRTYLSIKFPLQDEQGKIAGIGEIDTDVTQLKQAEREAIQAARQRERFLAVLSHELRNPLTAILGAASVIPGADPSGVAKWAAVVERRALHMARLLDDLLDVARITHDKIDIRKKLFDLGQTVDDVVEESRAWFDEKGLKLRIERPDTPLPIDGDPDRLQQIQVNLLANAAKYTPPGGEVRYRLAREGSQAVIRVRDTGAGLAPEMLEKAFELFVQGQDTQGRAGAGIGVGLALVKSIVELHGGRVRAESSGPGKGSEFIVSLPLAGQVVSVAATEGNSHPPPPRRSLRILLVEDDENIRELTARFLTMRGHQVRTAHDGASALAELDIACPELALIDIGLPDMDGYEVARRARGAFPPDRLALVALTGYGQQSDRQRALASGFDSHMTKPVRSPELDDLLASVVVSAD